MKAKDAFYFQHDSNARNDEKILELRAVFGWEGYGLFWALVELMRDADEYRIKRSLIKMHAQTLGVSRAKLTRLIDHAVAIGLFDADETAVWSPSLRRRMEIWDAKKEALSVAGREGAEKRWGGGSGDNAPEDEIPPPDDDSHPNGPPHSHPIAPPIAEDGRREDGRREECVREDAHARDGQGLSDPSVVAVRLPGGEIIRNSRSVVDSALREYHLPEHIRPPIEAWVECHDGRHPNQHDCRALLMRFEELGTEVLTLAIRLMGNAGGKAMARLDEFIPEAQRKVARAKAAAATVAPAAAPETEAAA